jgi:glycosyltransferase involved in cell wall biosynthesis
MSISIIIPTYNRTKFSPLISLNIKKQDYPMIKEVIVADDGKDNERLVLDVPYTVLYYKVPRMTIGEKRNFLMGKATGKYIACMDTDDFYHPSFLSTSIFNLIKSGKKVSGSSDMLILHDEKTYKQRCIYLNLLNEATLVFTKEYADSHKFSNSMSAEGISFLTGNLADICETEIEDIMVCIAHKENTVNKLPWTDEKYLATIDMTMYESHLKIFSLLNT